MGNNQTATSASSNNLKVLARARTRFNDIFVIEDGNKREMWFNGNGKFFLQTRIELDKPRAPALVYSKMIFATLLFHPIPKRILIIGLGGGALSNCLHAWYPETLIDVVEIDPKVTALAKKFFGVEEGPNYQVHSEDGRLFAQQQARKGIDYDIIYLDAFKSGSIPYHLKTLEFYRELESVLTPLGVVASNLYGKSNSMKPHDCETFLTVFPQIYLFEDTARVATVSIASREKTRWNRQLLEQRAAVFRPPAGMKLSMQEVVATFKEEGLAEPKSRVLRDDFAPQEFQKAVEQNNLQRAVGERAYPINNVS